MAVAPAHACARRRDFYCKAKSLDTMGAMHGYGIARRIEQVSGDALSVNYGTIYPALLRLEQEGRSVASGGFRSRTGGRGSMR